MKVRADIARNTKGALFKMSLTNAGAVSEENLYDIILVLIFSAGLKPWIDKR